MINEDTSEPSIAAAPALELHTLAPRYRKDQHGVYVEALCHVIENQPEVHNLALTGAYGTGKSSILNEIAKKFPDRVIQLSLSTVGDNPDTDDENDEVKPSGNPAAWTKTNRIQKEIVKQLLYKEEPRKTRGSRFRRITRFNRWRELRTAGYAGAIGSVLLYLAGFSGPLVALADNNLVWTILAYVAFAAVIAGIMYLVRALTHNQIFVEQLSAGPATVTLSSKSTSYFDEYLDEIVYRFEVSGRDIVIFEDIDRFEDVHIFETLRALNTLLNGSLQIKSRPIKTTAGSKSSIATPIRFVYAIRDSVFARLGEDDEIGIDSEQSRDEIERANRTKFFDLVLPVVPFITHRNARDLMGDAMEGKGVSKALIGLAAQHVADMRLIWNIRNEYDVYRHQLLGTGQSMPGLDEDRLFAMVLYKNVHLADFEAIRFGKSKLDELHRQWRLLVELNIDAETKSAREISNKIQDLDAVAERSTQMGKRLYRLAKHLNSSDVNEPQIDVGNVTKTKDELRLPQTWADIIADELTITVHTYSGYSNSGTFTLLYSSLPDFLGIAIDTVAWHQADLQELYRARTVAQENTEFLRHHSWMQLHQRYGFATLATESAPEGESFSRLTARILPSKLAHDLVARGYINDYFALYISMYYGKHLRHDALNYILRSVDRGERDLLYPLTGDDVDAILEDKTDGILSDQSMLNVSILDHLLGTRQKAAMVVIAQISAWGDVEKAIVTQYLNHGRYGRELLQRFSQTFRPIYRFLVASDELDDVTRASAFDAAMTGYSGTSWNSPDDGVLDYVQDNFPLFDSITNASAALQDTNAAIGFLFAINAVLPSVLPLNGRARTLLAKNGRYELTEENMVALTATADISLDTLLLADNDVYGKALKALHVYVGIQSAAASTPYSIKSRSAFLRVLNDVAATDPTPAVIAAVVGMASPDCLLVELSDAPPSMWERLVFQSRVPATFKNVNAYLLAAGHIDDALATLLTAAGGLTDVGGAGQDELAAIGVAILRSQNKIPSAQLRVSLCASLGLTEPLTTDRLMPEAGELLSLLLREHLIADDADAFDPNMTIDWPTRELAVEQSLNFPVFMEPALLPAAELKHFIESYRVPPAAKRALIDQIESFIGGSPEGTVAAISRYMANNRVPVDGPRLQFLLNEGAPASDVVQLLASNADTITTDQMRAVLRELGDGYALVADTTGKRPTLPDDAYHREILTRLVSVGIVNSFKQEDGLLRVFVN
jgi:hypothetical protein